MQQNNHLELGKINTLMIDRLTSPGAYLIALDQKDVLLPGQYLDNTMKEGDLLNVFLYTDSEDRLVATTQTPFAMLDEYALFEVVDNVKFGSFVDWGLPKDLFIPTKYQKSPFQIGEKRFLKIIYDEKTHRLVGTEKTRDFFNKKIQNLYPKMEVKILIIAKTPLGYKCIVEDKYEGLIYHNEIFEKIELGDLKTAYIKTVRKDNNIDLSLQKPGAKNNNSSTEKIIQLLTKNNGILPYNSKSDPELIKEVFEMSKKEFKRSLTTLKESNKIDIKDTGIYLKD